MQKSKRFLYRFIMQSSRNTLVTYIKFIFIRAAKQQFFTVIKKR